MNIKQIKLLANNKKHLEQLEHEVLEILNSGGGSTQITESWTETYTLNKNNIFNYVFLQILLANINATELSSENEYAEHYKLLRKTMQEMFPNVNYKIKIEFYDFIFFYYAEINEWDIEKLILESDDSILFDNMRTFCNLLPQIKLDPTKTLSILTFFDEKGKNDLATGRIYIALEKMIKNDDKYGLNLLDEIQKTDDYRFVYLISKNLSSLSYDHLVKYLKKLYKSKNVDEAVAALGAINFPDSDTANEISAFIKDEIVKENDFPANIVIAFLSILKNSNMLTEDNLNYLISYLEEALQRGSIETKYTFLNRITHIEIQDHDLAKSLKEKFLFESIDIGKDHVNLPRAISFLLRELSTAEQILKFIEKWALKHEFSLEPFFDWIVSDIYLKDTQGFQEALLPMLISGNPSIRHYANHIIEIEEIDLLKDIEIWSTIVSKLTAQSALYLMESILVLFSSIELRIQLLMPLSNSKDSTITNHLLQRFVWLTFDYYDVVKDIVEEYTKKEGDFYKQYSKYYDEIIKIGQIKRQLKEINPFHTMYSNYSRFQYLFFKKQNEIIKKTQEEHGGILSTVTSIQIGRGRSWRVSTDEPFGDFQEIKTLFTFPVTYHMAPEKNEFDLHMRRMRRW